MPTSKTSVEIIDLIQLKIPNGVQVRQRLAVKSERSRNGRNFVVLWLCLAALVRPPVVSWSPTLMAAVPVASSAEIRQCYLGWLISLMVSPF